MGETFTPREIREMIEEADRNGMIANFCVSDSCFSLYAIFIGMPLNSDILVHVFFSHLFDDASIQFQQYDAPYIAAAYVVVQKINSQLIDQAAAGGIYMRSPISCNKHIPESPNKSYG